MKSEVIDSGWGAELERALQVDASELLVISPFIKLGAIVRLMKPCPTKIRVLTRFNLRDFASGVSDIEAIRELINAGADVRGVRNLHAKLYLFGMSRAFITSANLTTAGLERNHEFGVATSENELIEECREYFESIWERAGQNIEISKISSWEEEILKCRVTGRYFQSFDQLMDEGADLGLPASEGSRAIYSFADRVQAIVKFLGKGDYRAPLSNKTLDEVKESGCHWALTYPRNKRPRSVEDGAMMFIARLIDDGDIRIYGRAIGLAYKQGRDDATSEDIKNRNWKTKYPHYIRVYGSEFVDGTLENGVSLAELINTLGTNSFASTQRRATAGEASINPRLSIRRQAALKLSNEGTAWLTRQLELKFATYGTISRAKLRNLDWPAMPEISY